MAIGDYQRKGEWIEVKLCSNAKEIRGCPHNCEPKKYSRGAFRFHTHSVGEGVEAVGGLVKQSKYRGRIPYGCNREE